MQGVIELCHAKILSSHMRPTANIPYPSKQHKAVVPMCKKQWKWLPAAYSREDCKAAGCRFHAQSLRPWPRF